MTTSQTCRILLLAAAVLFAGCSNEPEPVAKPDSDPAPASSQTAPDNAPATAEDQTTAQTPEAVFASFKQAFQDGDMERAAGHLTEESQAVMCVTLMIGAGFVAAFDEDKGPRIEELFRQHGLDVDPESEPDVSGLTQQQAMQKLADPIQDKPRFIGEVSRLMDSLSDDPQQQPMASGELQDLQIDGDTASGMIVAEDTQEPIDFVRVDGQWKIQLPEDVLTMGEGQDASVNFSGDASFGDFDMAWDDSEFANWQWDYSEELELAPYSELPLQDFQASWQVSLNETDVPAGELLQRLAQELQLEWVEPDPELPQLNEPVSLSLDKVSRLQAVHEVAAQVGLHPRYLLSKLTVAAEPAPMAVTFAGPFRVELAEVDELVPAGAAQVTLRIHAHGLSESAVALLESLSYSSAAEMQQDDFTLKITEQLGTGQKSLQHPDPDGMGTVAQYTRHAIQWVQSMALLNTTRDVTEIESLAGEISFVLPTKVEKLRFDSLASGTELQAGDATFELNSADSAVSVSFQNADLEAVQIFAEDSDGNPLQPFSTSWDSVGDAGSLAAFFESEVAAVGISITQETERVTYPFAFQNIPLPHHEQQPESIPELTYDGDSPLEVEFLGLTKNEFDQSSAEVRLHNRSNREITSLSATLSYLDESGTELDDSPTSHMFDPIPAGETATEEIATFFMPEETKSVRVQIDSVTFADLTTWVADE